jgi:4-amino-4-deoxy-L-arabinose transferase-like glycosyltransferase
MSSQTRAAPVTLRFRAPASRSLPHASVLTGATLLAITAVAARLRLAHLGSVPDNPFYDAAVRTMAGSWHAFLFGALDPSGGVSVDKPPVDLWLQVASVKLLGYSPTALKLPQALAGIASVPLLFDLVRRGLGRAAGLAAAASLAVLPVAVMTARSDTMDTFMSFLVLAAAWFVVIALERDRARWLLAAGATIGLAFNVKLFQALLPLPALAAMWFVGSRLRPGRRILTAVAATVVATVVAFAWIVPVALTPASQRPYPIGSTNGSVWNLVFVFNGVDRLHGRPITTPDTLPPGTHVSAAVLRSQEQRARRVATTAGATRLLGRHFGATIGSELFPALATLGALLALAAFWLIRRRRPPTDARLGIAVAAMLAVWLAIGTALFSKMTSFHPRYFETISPAVAGMLGAGLCVLVLRGGRAGRLLAAAVLAATGLYAGTLASTAGASGHVELVACLAVAALLAVSAAGRALPRLLPPVAALAAIAAVLIVPLSASRTVVQTRAFDAERSGAMPPGWPQHFNHYLTAHRGRSRYAFASIAPAKAAPLIADDPQPVLMLTSYHSQPLISVPRLARLVRGGQVRYFLIGRRCTSALTRHTAACPPTAHWAIAHSTDVTPALGIGHRGLLYRIDYCRVTTPAATPARARGRSATPSARPRSATSASRASRAMCVQSRTAAGA